MTSLYQRARVVFLAALSRPALEREAFLFEACEGDAALLREVESLFLFHDGGSVAEADPFQERQEFSAGDLFADRYRMVSRVGRGGMGDVWRADDMTLDAPVALKLMPAAKPSDRQRLLQEVRLARRITHPAVCRVFDVGEAGESMFLSMELVQGEDLAALLRRTGRLTSERVADIARQLCAGLAAAHAEGVFHRDLKPANVLIDLDGRVRITDFGIAVTTSDVGPQALIGTPGYMAPEQLAPDGAISERTDIYALGVILYELVTGHPHHTLRSDDAASQLAALAPGINPQLERAIVHAIRPNPQDRPATALHLAAQLRDTDATQRDNELAIPSKPGHRRTSAWFATAATITALVASIAAFAWGRSMNDAASGPDMIILTDFVSTTGNPGVDNALKVALAVAVERELAAHEQLKFVAGSFTTMGRHYVVALKAVNPQSSGVMASQQVTAPSFEALRAYAHAIR